MAELGPDAQSFILAYTGEPCEMCAGEGQISDEGLRFGSQQCVWVDCPECEGQGLVWPEDAP